MNYEQIAKANSEIKLTDVKGKNYAEVNQRITAFRKCYPDGFIQTEIISLEGGVVMMQSKCGFYQNETPIIIGTGMAYEKEDSSYINKTSYIENCETSAVGRALGMAGFGVDTSVASAEEVANAINNQDKGKKAAQPVKTEDDLEKTITDEQRLALIKELDRIGKTVEWLEDFAKTPIKKLTRVRAEGFIRQLKSRPDAPKPTPEDEAMPDMSIADDDGLPWAEPKQVSLSDL